MSNLEKKVQDDVKGGKTAGKILGKIAGYLAAPLIATAIADKYNLEPGQIALGAYPIMLFTQMTGLLGSQIGKYMAGRKYQQAIEKA